MNKNELVEYIVDSENVPRSAAIKAVNALMKGIEKALTAGQDVMLRGLGTFKVKPVATKKAYNFSKGKMVIVPAGKTVKFILSKELKNKIQ